MTSVQPAATAPKVTFLRHAMPPLQDATYVLTATQTIPGQNPGTFPAKATFVVNGERFTIRPTEIDSVFPPNLANGGFGGVLPHVVFNRRTLPWERGIAAPESADPHPGAPWLAVLICDEAAALEPKPATVKDLAPEGTAITAAGSAVTGTGTLPATTLSYGAAQLKRLGYGEAPDDQCTVIDLPVATFNQIAPAAADLPYLAHVREVDTSTGADSAGTSERHAVVIANRVPAARGVTRAFLVSLEGMAGYLPGPDGARSPAVGPSIDTVRLIVHLSWTFTVDDRHETLDMLLQGLSTRSSLTLPIDGDVPSAPELARATANQAKGQVPADDARILVQNALLMGYLPLDHHLRHGGRTVSFYRGPFVPLPVPAAAPAYYPGPDAANAYDPQTGLFDVSYGAAWQLGQLLALRSSGVANQLYQWKRTVTLQQANAEEDALLARRLNGAPVFPSFLGRRTAIVGAPPPLPDEVVTWLGDLAALRGVPFHYLVPDEHMLPPESIRFFHVDQNWIDALLDGAFSIGRATVSGQTLEAEHAPRVRGLARSAAGRRRANLQAASGPPPTAPVSGFLLRSQAVAGWPNLRVAGYRDAEASDSVNAVRVERLSADTMLCLFDDVVASMYLREPPEQLHHGVEEVSGGYYTALRSVTGGPGPVAPGQRYSTGPAPVPVRADGRTLQVSAAATAIATRLGTDFEQRFAQGFTAAEFALELTRGVTEVEFTR
jgi:hypothetical protein